MVVLTTEDVSSEVMTTPMTPKMISNMATYAMALPLWLFSRLKKKCNIFLVYDFDFMLLLYVDA